MPRQLRSIFLSTTILAALSMPGTAFACPEFDTNCYLYSAENANRDLDETAFFDALAAARRALAHNPAATPAERAGVLRLEGIGAAWRGDIPAATAAFREARRLDPDASLPLDLYPPDHPIARLYASAAGPPAPAPLIVLAPEVPAPEITVVKVELPPGSIQRSRPFFLGAAASGLLSGGLFALARSVEDVEVSAPSDPAAFIDASAEATSRRMALQTASGSAALVSAGLLTAGVTVRW